MTDGVTLSVFQPPFRVENRSDGQRVGGVNFTANERIATNRLEQPVSIGLSSRAQFDATSLQDQRSVDRFIAAINGTTPRTRDTAINLIGPFFRAAQTGRSLTGEEAGQIGEAFFALNANAGFGTTPQSLSTQQRETLLNSLNTFDAVIQQAGPNQLNASQRDTLDRTIRAVSDQLDAPISSTDLAATIRNSLENVEEQEPSLFDFSGTQLRGLSGSDVSDTVNDVTAINRDTATGADDSSLSNSRVQLLDRLVTEFDQILGDAGSSQLLSGELRRLGTITTLINTLLQSSAPVVLPASSGPGPSNLEALLGGRSDDNPLVISLR